MRIQSPPNWAALQLKAKQAKNARDLAAIIEEMNKLLSEYEKAEEPVASS